METSVVERGNDTIRMKSCARCFATLIVALLAAGGASAQDRAGAYRQSVLAIQQQIESGDLAGARSALGDAMKRYPADGGLENLLGVIEIQQGHASAARQAFLSAVRHDPQLVGAYLNLSRVDMQTAASDAKARDEALQMSGKVLQLDASNDEARYQIATIFAWQKNYARSLAELNRLSQQARSAVGAEALACEDQAGIGEREATDAAARLLAGNADLTEQDANECIPTLRTARRADLIEILLKAAAAHQPLSPSGVRMLGLAQEASGERAEARATLERAFAAGGGSVGTLVDLTRVAEAAGDHQGALGYLAHARDLDPKDAALPYEFGAICLRMGLYAEARKAIGAALQIEPDNPDYNLGMGLVVSFSEDPAQAIPYLQKYHVLRPTDANGVLALGSASFRAKDYDTAATWLKQAVANRSTAAEAHYYLGRIARQEGRLDEATTELKETLRQEPDQASAMAELGQIAVARRDNAQASMYLERAVQLDPDNYAANFGLLQLYARTNDPRREQQAKRFEEVKDKKDARDLEMMRSLEIRRNGDSGSKQTLSKTNH